MEIARRTLLLAGLAGIAGLAVGCGPDEPHAGTYASGSFVSRRRGDKKTGWTILYPPGHDRAALPVLIALHGRTGSHEDAYSSLELDRHLADVVGAGAKPFAIASVDGGDHDYWHPRRDGDPAGMVVDEFLPVLADRGLRVDRPAFLGWSMGGYGALYLGTVLGAARVAAIVAESPAIWHRAEQTVEGSFDDADDFAKHRIFGRLDRLRGIPMRVDCGDRDGFAPVTRDLRDALSPTPAGGIERGGHDQDYWRTQASAQLRFVARHLTR